LDVDVDDTFAPLCVWASNWSIDVLGAVVLLNLSFAIVSACPVDITLLITAGLLQLRQTTGDKNGLALTLAEGNSTKQNNVPILVSRQTAFGELAYNAFHTMYSWFVMLY
jgi:hypothetical protein